MIPFTSIPEAVARATGRMSRLSLASSDIAFLAAIYAYLELECEADLDEFDLNDLFMRAMETLNEEDSASRFREALTRLRVQRLVSCVSGADISSADAPRYSMTQLGRAIASDAIGTDIITALTLEVILGKINGEVLEMCSMARVGGNRQFWETQISVPLDSRHMALFDEIDRRQHNMDETQEVAKHQITHELELSWADGIDACVANLDVVLDNLKDITQVYEKYNDRVSEALNEIAEIALVAGETHAAGLARRAESKLERIKKWADQRFSDWHRYYQKIVVDVIELVRSDPHRLKIKHLIGSAKHLMDRPLGITCVANDSFTGWREPDRKMERVVINPVSIEEEDPMGRPDQLIADAVAKVLSDSLHEPTLALTDLSVNLANLVSKELYFTALGALTEALCNEGMPRSSHQVGWHEVPLGIQVEEIIVDRTVQGDDGE